MLKNNSLYLPLHNFARFSKGSILSGSTKHHTKGGILKVYWYFYPSLTEDICYTYKFKNREVAWERSIKRACSYPYYYRGEEIG